MPLFLFAQLYTFVFLFSIPTDILYKIVHKIESIKISQIKLYYAIKIIYLGFIQSIPKLSYITP